MALEREVTELKGELIQAQGEVADAEALAAKPPVLSKEHRERLWQLTQVRFTTQKGLLLLVRCSHDHVGAHWSVNLLSGCSSQRS